MLFESQQTRQPFIYISTSSLNLFYHAYLFTYIIQPFPCVPIKLWHKPAITGADYSRFRFAYLFRLSPPASDGSGIVITCPSVIVGFTFLELIWNFRRSCVARDIGVCGHVLSPLGFVLSNFAFSRLTHVSDDPLVVGMLCDTWLRCSWPAISSFAMSTCLF